MEPDVCSVYVVDFFMIKTLVPNATCGFGDKAQLFYETPCNLGSPKVMTSGFD